MGQGTAPPAIPSASPGQATMGGGEKVVKLGCPGFTSILLAVLTLVGDVAVARIGSG